MLLLTVGWYSVLCMQAKSICICTYDGIKVGQCRLYVMYNVYGRGGGSSFTLVRQILQTWTYMCGKQGYLQDLENMMYKSYCA